LLTVWAGAEAAWSAGSARAGAAIATRRGSAWPALTGTASAKSTWPTRTSRSASAGPAFQRHCGFAVDLGGGDDNILHIDRIELLVADQGNGVPEEILQRLFDPFFRVDDAGTREAGE